MGFRKKQRPLTFAEIEEKHRVNVQNIQNSQLSDEEKHFALRAEKSRYRQDITNSIHGT
jgi:hypothetical protein